jgi:hypothetical protein
MNERVVLFYYSDLEMPDSDKVALKCSAGMVADQSVRRRSWTEARNSCQRQIA